VPNDINEHPIYKIMEFNDFYYSIKMILVFYILSKIVNLFNEKFLLMIVLNVIIFYAVLEKRCAYFLFKAMMIPQQICEGILGIISCLIPKYEEPKVEEEK
jgi:hypothetical protein